MVSFGAFSAITTDEVEFRAALEGLRMVEALDLFNQLIEPKW